MKILYGVQATGNGHVSRSREVVHCLKELGHDVRVVLSGKDADRLKNIAIFNPCDTYQGLTFSTSRGKLQYFKTATQLGLIQFYREIFNFKATDLDLVITDFEPITARVADRFNIPSIGIGHQYAFCYPIPVAGANPLSQWILKSFAPVDYPVGLHWHHFNQPILPPIIPNNLNGIGSHIEKKILVYLPFEHPDDVKRLLASFKEMEFFIYGVPDLNQKVDQDNLYLRPFSRSGFLKDLRDSNGVISNAGFELTSEAFQLGKKVLVKPLAGQLEQLSNALAVRKLNLGTVMNELSAPAVETWLHQPSTISAGYPNVAKMIAKWVDQGDWRQIGELKIKSWQQTKNIPNWYD
jgi:uncharacterized protein (TIGR00661 family)